MTQDKDFKRLVRARMAETGETYTAAYAALRSLSGDGRPADGPPPAARPAPRASADHRPIPRDARVFVSGHAGLVGAALLRRLRAAGFTNLLTARRDQLDLRDQAAVNYWFRANRPEYVFLVAGTVGGILANSTRPAEFLYDNMMIHATVVHASHLFAVEKLLYLGSSCIYPRDAAQPITEDALLTGPLEPTNDAYALAKIAGIKLCSSYREQYGCDFTSAMPTNVYGPGDNFDATGGHLVPMLIRRFDEVRRRGDRTVTVWGTGTPRRELLHVDDLAAACLFLMDGPSQETFVNVGTGRDHTIREIASLVRDLVHPGSTLEFDTSMPDGVPRKVLDVSRINRLGWTAEIDLPDGLRSMVDWYRAADRVRGLEPPADAA